MGSAAFGWLLGVTCSLSACCSTQTGNTSDRVSLPALPSHLLWSWVRCHPACEQAAGGKPKFTRIHPRGTSRPGQCLSSLPPGLAQWQDPSGFSHAVNTPLATPPYAGASVHDFSHLQLFPRRTPVPACAARWKSLPRQARTSFLAQPKAPSKSRSRGSWLRVRRAGMRHPNSSRRRSHP